MCYDVLSQDTAFEMDKCRHTFCRACWADYLNEKINADSSGIDALCMQNGCNLKVRHSMFEELLDDTTKVKYWKWLVKSLADVSPTVRWCPDTQCELVCEKSDETRLVREVVCECGTTYCFICGKYPHAPCDCTSAKKWLEKGVGFETTEQYLAANSKACPGCKRPIEKNQGCNHMTCSQCKHEFCWLCLIEWKEHCMGNNGGYYNCLKR